MLCLPSRQRRVFPLWPRSHARTQCRNLAILHHVNCSWTNSNLRNTHTFTHTWLSSPLLHTLALGILCSPSPLPSSTQYIVKLLSLLCLRTTNELRASKSIQLRPCCMRLPNFPARTHLRLVAVYASCEHRLLPRYEGAHVPR